METRSKLTAALAALRSPRAFTLQQSRDSSPARSIVTELDPASSAEDTTSPSQLDIITTRLAQAEGAQAQFSQTQTRILDLLTALSTGLGSSVIAGTLPAITVPASSSTAAAAIQVDTTPPATASGSTPIATITTTPMICLPVAPHTGIHVPPGTTASTIKLALPPMKGDPWVPYSEKIEYERWALLYLNKIRGSELHPLIDQNTGKLVDDTTDVALDERLYGRLMESLGPDNPYLLRSDLAGKGLKVFAAHASAKGIKNTIAFLQHQKALFWGPLLRNPSEDLDDYVGRFTVLAHRIGETNLDSHDIRIRFLATLGGVYTPLHEQITQNRLESKFLSMSWEDLLADLRKWDQKVLIHQITAPPLSTTTAASSGYSANAALSTSAADADKVAKLEAKIATLEKAASQHMKQQAKAALPDIYCHTHGYGKNPLHTSLTCLNRSAGHNEFATANDTMGGSVQRHQPRK